jgi:hypothetical protein
MRIANIKLSDQDSLKSEQETREEEKTKRCINQNQTEKET